MHTIDQGRQQTYCRQEMEIILKKLQSGTGIFALELLYNCHNE